jgi:hypothetical protein
MIDITLHAAVALRGIIIFFERAAAIGTLGRAQRAADFLPVLVPPFFSALWAAELFGLLFRGLRDWCVALLAKAIDGFTVCLILIQNGDIVSSAEGFHCVGRQIHSGSDGSVSGTAPTQGFYFFFLQVGHNNHPYKN